MLLDTAAAELFDEIDADHDGTLTRAELTKHLKKLGVAQEMRARLRRRGEPRLGRRCGSVALGLEPSRGV